VTPLKTSALEIISKAARPSFSKEYLTMRIAIVLLLLAAALAPLRADDKVPAKKESVAFDGTTLLLASTNENPGERVREFIPEGQKLDSWTKLASIREYPKLDDPRAVAENVLRALKQQNPAAQGAIIQNPKTGEVIVDFVTWPADNAFVEFNVFKYSQKPGGGLVAQQFALREYKDTSAFLKGLKPMRTRLIELMAKGGLEIKP
jgi:hypothetical protein